MKSSARIIWKIGAVTFREILRDKLLYGGLGVAVFLLALSVLASRLSLGFPDRAVMDFGLTAVHLYMALVSILIGALILGREFDRRTAYVALSKPITRFEFLLGKAAGLFAINTLNGIFLAAGFLSVLYLSGGHLNTALIWGLVLVWVQAQFLGFVALLFSTQSTLSLSALFAIGVYAVGTNVPQIRLLATKLDSHFLAGFLNWLARLWPNLNLFQLGFKVTYDLPVTWQYGVTAIFYGIIYSVFVLGLAGVIFNRKEI